MSNFKMDDYVPVNERIEAFYAKHPEGSIQSEIVELTEGRVTVKAYAYRSDSDTRPGIGHSSLEIPGTTAFTRGSEIENAETSAWGRAIAALGFEVKRGLASAEEVRNKQPERSERAPAPGRRAGSLPATTSAPAQRTPEEQALIGQLLDVPLMTTARMSLLSDAVGVKKGERATADQLREMLRRAEQPGAGVPPPPAGEAAGSSVPAASTTVQSEGSPDTSGSDGPTPAAVELPPSTATAAPNLPPCPVCGKSDLFIGTDGAIGCPHCEVAVTLPESAPTDEELLAAAGPGAEIVPPELQERIEKARARGKKAEPQQETLAEALGSPVVAE